MLPIMTAWANGEQIQFKSKDDEWVDCGDAHFYYFPTADRWRIKPKPREFWLCIYKQNPRQMGIHTCKQAGIERICDQIKVIEVL